MAITQLVTRLIKDLAVTTAKLAANAVSLAKLGALSAKGDVLTHDGTDHKRLPVGANGEYLVADSAQTNGIKWLAFSGLTATNFVSSEVPTGTINGTNDTFTLANTPTAGSLHLYVNGVRMNPLSGNDYTIATATITFLSGAIPQTGDVILADYLK